MNGGGWGAVLRCGLGLAMCVWPGLGWAQGSGHAPEKIIIDTDIGDDVDDAFALAVAVKSPELQVLGVMTTFGDTVARAKIVDRFLGEVGRSEIPVLAGKATATKTFPPSTPTSPKPATAPRGRRRSLANAVCQKSSEPGMG